MSAPRYRNRRNPARPKTAGPPATPGPAAPAASVGNPARNSGAIPAPPTPEAGRALTLESFFTRACSALVFFILVLIPLLYPLRLPDDVIQGLRSQHAAWWHNFYLGQLDPFFCYGYQPLPFKEAAFTILLTILLFCWLGRVLMRARAEAEPGAPRFDWKIYGPIAALLLWGAAALVCSGMVLLAAPTRYRVVDQTLVGRLTGLIAMAVTPLARVLEPAATPTFYWSLITYVLLAAGLLWFIVVYEMPKNPRLVRRWFNAILLAGFVVAFFAFLQDVDRQRRIVRYFFVDVEQAALQGDLTLLRQRMGSLIGHNIGVAGLLSFSWFILLSRLFQPGPLRRRIACGAGLAFLFFVIAACQTRGVWVVLAVLTPCHLIWLLRITQRRLDLKPILGGILLILIILVLQVVPSPRNPFYSPESPLVVRFTHFSPTYLLSETRLRIAVCSLPLLHQRPFYGHGLGSFQYVYPAAQADYFARYPDTVLSPTANFTVQAHSDWLQVLIELGLPGLLIVLLGLYFMLRRGWDGWEQLSDPSLRLELTAALLGVAGVMMHALVDFPGHVVSTITPALFLLAIWASCGRLEQRPAAVAAAPDPPPAPSRRLRSGFAALVLLLILPGAVVLAGWFGTLLQASMYESLGTSYRIYYGEHSNDPNTPESEKRRALAEAHGAIKQALKIAPLDCELVFRLGDAATLYGVLDVITASKVQGSTAPMSLKIGLVARLEADRLLREGIELLTDCQREIRRQEVFHDLGLCYENLYALYGREEDRQAAKQSYRLALRYSPCFSRSLYRLFVLLQKDNPPHEEELRAVCRQLARYDLPLFQRQFIDPVLKASQRYDLSQVALRADVLLDALPQRADLWLLKVHALASTGRAAEAEALLELFHKSFPGFSRELSAGYEAEAALAAQRHSEAARLAGVALTAPGQQALYPYYRCLRAAALEKLGQPEAKAAWDEVETLARENFEYLNAAATVFLFPLPDADRAYGYLMRYCNSQPVVAPGMLRIAADLTWKRGDQKQARELLRRCLEFDLDDPQALKMREQFKP